MLLRAALPALLLGSCAAPGPSFGDREVVAVWVTRWDYKTAADVRRIIADVKALGATDVLWQCRGAADAYYRSALEPWGELLGGRDPGFDPLDIALEEAHNAGMRLHAWINVMPIWRGTKPPPPDSVAGRHPDWIVVGRDGKPQAAAKENEYLCANPASGPWLAHVGAVIRDLAVRYDVDGIHLDYIRYLEGDFSYDRASLDRFGQDPAKAPEEWSAFRRGLVTGVVRLAREAAWPKLVTAAVYPSAKARGTIHQDAELWVREGLVDAVFPMQYRADDAAFEELVAESRRDLGARSYTGIGVHLHGTAGQTARQIDLVRASGGRGFALFSYGSFHPTASEDPVPPEGLRAARIAAVREKTRAR
jgi:uncharacterized lipoprotein YddW (UPF0748 family)